MVHGAVSYVRLGHGLLTSTDCDIPLGVVTLISDKLKRAV